MPAGSAPINTEEEYLIQGAFTEEDQDKARGLFKEVRGEIKTALKAYFRIGEIMSELSEMTSKENFVKVQSHLGLAKRNLKYAMRLAAIDNDEWKVSVGDGLHWLLGE